MSAIAIASIVFVCVFGGALLGLFLRDTLPEHHLSEQTKDVVKIVAGLIATLAALVLGLLVASAKSSYDAVNEGFRQSAIKVILLDRALAQYGPETRDIRETLRTGFTARIDELTTRDPAATRALKSSAATTSMEGLGQRIRALTPQNDAQRAMQSKALGILDGVSEARWVAIEHEDNTTPTPFLVVMVFWLTAMFLSFGLFSPHNTVAVVALFLGAASLSAAVFLIEELYTPLEGWI